MLPSNYFILFLPAILIIQLMQREAIVRLFVGLRENAGYRNKWFTAKAIAETINRDFYLDDDEEIDGSTLNIAVSKSYLDNTVEVFSELNHHGIFRRMKKLGKQKTTYYMLTIPGNLPRDYGKKWWMDASDKPPPAKKVTKAKRWRRVMLKTSRGKKRRKTAAIKYDQELVNWWYSEKANELFRPNDGERPIEAIIRRKEFLKDCLVSANSYKNLILGGDEDGRCTEEDRRKLVVRATSIVAAMNVALEKMPFVSFLGCCEEAATLLDKIGFGNLCGETIRKWHSYLRDQGGFVHPRGPDPTNKDKARLPPFLRENPDIAGAYSRKATDFLSERELSAQKMAEYFNDVLLPAIQNGRGISEDGDIIDSAPDNIREDNINLRRVHCGRLSRRKANEWLICLGFRYEPRKKSYYVDGHENPKTRRYRKDFVLRYLQTELRCFRWIQMTREQFDDLVSKKMISKKAGHAYKRGDGLWMVEIHIDDASDDLRQQASLEYKFGANTSIRLNGLRPLIIFGQDECIFRQYSLTTKSWVGPDGERTADPKDDGYGLMISGYQSREFGYGMELTVEELQLVNEYRLSKKYFDQMAALKARSECNKQPLTSSPFHVEFRYGAANEGYWTYEHAVCQLEDCIDVMKVLYPQFDVMFLFDHSCGHDRARPDGLHINNMNKLFGGLTAKALRKSKIECADGYLGPHNPLLSVGDYQFFVFKESDDGPFWMDKEESEYRRYDHTTGKKKKRKLRVDELQNLLEQHTGTRPCGTLEKLQELCGVAKIPTVVEEDDILEGWVGKPKGLLQILYERGWIDEENVDAYSRKGPKTGIGKERDLDFSLDDLLGSCSDFATEMTQMQWVASSLGCEVDRTPKCHPELAGEGIEYTWGRAKQYYRAAKLKLKRTKDGFEKLVSDSLSDNVVPIDLVRKFAKRARSYILAYYMIEHGLNIHEEFSEVKHSDIEKIARKFKTHRSMLDIDYGFLNNCA